MNKKKPFRALVGIVCVLVVVLLAGIAIILDSRSPNPILGIFRTEPTDQDDDGIELDIPLYGQDTPPEDLPPKVDIPVQKDPQTGESLGIAFPCQVPSYPLVIAQMDTYSGMYVEDGEQAQTDDVAMLLVRNDGNTPITYTQICVEFNEQKLYFDVSALPAGAQVVVQEKNKQPMPQQTATAASATVVQNATTGAAESKIRVSDNGDNTLTIQNVSDKTLQSVRVYYKYYMPEQGVYVGGIAFTVRITRLAAGASVTIQPSHYTSSTSRVVMVEV